MERKLEGCFKIMPVKICGRNIEGLRPVRDVIWAMMTEKGDENIIVFLES